MDGVEEGFGKRGSKKSKGQRDKKASGLAGYRDRPTPVNVEANLINVRLDGEWRLPCLRPAPAFCLLCFLPFHSIYDWDVDKLVDTEPVGGARWGNGESDVMGGGWCIWLSVGVEEEWARVRQIRAYGLQACLWLLEVQKTKNKGAEERAQFQRFQR